MEGDFRVGDWLVQPQVGTITKEDEMVHLEPKVMEVLVYLAQHTKKVLPKERIIQAVWGDASVTDEVLTNAISELRRAFGDDARDPHIVQTLPRRGYRLIAPVTLTEEEHPDIPVLASKRFWQLRVMVVLTASLLLAVVLIRWWSPVRSTEEPIDSIAVLPFFNVGGDPENEYLSVGIPRSISSNLCKVADLRVIPSSVLERYRGQPPDAETAAEELEVRSVLSGTVLRREEVLVVSVELIDALTNRLLWGEQYSRQFVDIFEVQEEIATEVADALRPQLTIDEQRQLTRRFTNSPAAYEAYLKGDYLLRQPSTDVEHETLKRMIGYFERAIELDSNFAQAYAAMGGSYFHKANALTGSEEDYHRSRDAIERAIAIDPKLVLAHQLKAWILWSWEKDWAEAEVEFQKVAELDPNFRPFSLVWYLNWLGRRSEAIEMIERETERSDPLSVPLLNGAAWALFGAREFGRAVGVGKTVLELEPDTVSAHWLLLYAYDALGRYQEAFEAFRSGGQVTGEWSEEYEDAWGNSGMDGVWRVSIDKQIERANLRAWDMALRYARIGDKEKALGWLDKAAKEPLSSPLATHPHIDSLRDDPRFEQFLRKLNLPEGAIQSHLALPGEIP